VGQIDGQSENKGGRNQKRLLGVEVQDGIIHDLNSSGFLYQFWDNVDEEEVDGHGGPYIVPFHYTISRFFQGGRVVLCTETPEPRLELALVAVEARRLACGPLLPGWALGRALFSRNLICYLNTGPGSPEFKVARFEAGTGGFELFLVEGVHCMCCLSNDLR